jgi:hypothetical protein
MAKSFLGAVKDYETMTVRNIRYIATEAIQDTMEDAMETVAGITRGGAFEINKLPVDEGELVGSLSVDGGPESENSYITAIAGLKIGDTMNFEWTAPHALPVELGSGNTQGRHFVGGAARKFPEFVKKRAAEVRK